MITNFLLTDALGSVQAVISNTQNSATLLSNQVFSPYGAAVSQNGNTFSQYTTKGFTGQYTDPTSGLDYYVSRYYDPVAGIFLSADVKEGNAQGMNPYAYVAENPETLTDPSGQAYVPPCCGDPSPQPSPPPPPAPPDHGPTCGPDPSLCEGGNQPTPKPTPHAKQVSLTRCDVECQNEKNAQQLAKNAAGFFGFLANVLSDLENWISLDTLFGWDKQAESLITFFESAFASLGNPTVGGFISALPRLASIAQDLANGFAAEANHPLGWFTVQNVENDWGNVLEPSVIDGAEGIGTGVGIALAGVAVIGFSDGSVLEFAGKAAQAGLTSAEVVGVSTIAMNIIGIGYLQEEVDDLAPPTPIREFR